jgi:hypothetical protein
METPMATGFLRFRLRLLCLFVAIFAFVSISPRAFAQEAVTREALLNRFLLAVQEHSYENFVALFIAQGANAERQEKSQKTQAMKQLDLLSQALASRLKNGYKTSFLGSLTQRGVLLFLWKLEYRDGGDDDLVYMASERGTVLQFGVRPPSFILGS